MEGQNRYDFTPLFADASTFREVTKDLVAPFANKRIEKVAAIDALGFALGGSVASFLNAELILLRKGGKTPWDVSMTTFTDYSDEVKRLELATDAIQPGERVLLVDDWSETGAQLRAAVKLIERLRGHVIGVALIGYDEEVKKLPELSALQFNCLVLG